MHLFEFVAGLALVAIILFDVFQSVVLPRPTPVIYRLSAGLVWGLWALCRRTALRLPSAGTREQLLGTFAPFVVVLLLLLWAAGLVVGYGLMLYALAGQIHPRPENLGTALYFSGTSMLTIGFGDLAPTGGLARAIVLVAAANGLAVVALVITFLFTLFGSFQRREILVITLSARAGAPPSGVTLLETYAKFAMLGDLPRVFADWEVWAAEVLDSHLSYPILAYFRSTHDNQSWISALGAVLDAATLILTTVEDGPRGPALLMHKVGTHLVEDLAQYFGLDGTQSAYVERDEYEMARERLGAAGFRLSDADPSWEAFSLRRATYAARLNSMARLWVTPPAQWIGDRSYMRPHGKSVVHQ